MRCELQGLRISWIYRVPGEYYQRPEPTSREYILYKIFLSCLSAGCNRQAFLAQYFIFISLALVLVNMFLLFSYLVCVLVVQFKSQLSSFIPSCLVLFLVVQCQSLLSSVSPSCLALVLVVQFQSFLYSVSPSCLVLVLVV